MTKQGGKVFFRSVLKSTESVNSLFICYQLITIVATKWKIIVLWRNLWFNSLNAMKVLTPYMYHNLMLEPVWCKQSVSAYVHYLLFTNAWCTHFLMWHFADELSEIRTILRLCKRMLLYIIVCRGSFKWNVRNLRNKLNFNFTETIVQDLLFNSVSLQ